MRYSVCFSYRFLRVQFTQELVLYVVQYTNDFVLCVVQLRRISVDTLFSL